MAEEKDCPDQGEKQKCKACPPPGAPMWMTTYSDMVTLLLTFFVLLLSMADINPVKVVNVTNSLRETFGTSPIVASNEFKTPIIPSPSIVKFSPVSQEMTVKLHERIKAELQLKNMSKQAEVIMKDAETIILRIDDAILFKPANADLYPQAHPVLRNIADIIRPLPMKLRIEGHTDDTLMGDSPTGNWDLSVDRAVTVMRFFNQGDMMPLDRMAAVGYGAARPVVANADEEARAKNRRVDFVLRLEKVPGDPAPSGKTTTVPL